MDEKPISHTVGKTTMAVMLAVLAFALIGVNGLFAMYVSSAEVQCEPAYLEYAQLLTAVCAVGVVALTLLWALFLAARRAEEREHIEVWRRAHAVKAKGGDHA